ncbi:hypothetical protein [Natrinema versiforme]|uniref:Uncharacterized protein n=1 Tax=Natrinema versiforme JCM 10478 TaxID=1227496 RepID=L9XXX6_9EURY|nr:hypothetical protein [Natrinema versiforme]ELY66281.1 hypothetical protein C489_13006 [Natrinema versiforme JCM 10478]
MATDVSEESDKRGEIFSDDEFWYKLDVDWEEVKEEFESEQSDDDTDSEEDDDAADGPETIAEALLYEFAKGKKKTIEAEHETVSIFVSTVQAKADTEVRQAMRSLYVDHQWSLKQKQDKFDCDQIESVLSQLSSDGTVVREEVNGDYDILWPGNSAIDKEVRDSEVTARKLLKTEPVIVKKSDDGRFVVRGANKSRSKIVDRVRANTTAESVEPNRKQESVSDRVHEALTEQESTFREHFKIIETNYTDSALPSRPNLSLKNSKGLEDDLYELHESGYLPAGGMSGLSSFRVEDVVYGGRHKIELTHRRDGFLFNSEATRKTDEERERFERRFATIADIEFDTIYEYGSADKRYLLNQILSEDYDAYQLFYDKLPDELQEFVDDVLKTDDDDELELVEEKKCQECGYEADPDAEECNDCGEEQFTDVRATKTKVTDNAIATKINYALKNISPSHDRVDFLSFETTTRELTKERVSEADVKIHRDRGDADLISRRQVFFAPTGSGARLQRFNDYMLEGVYVTYGKSAGRQFTGYGSLTLYDLLFNEQADTDKLVGNAVYSAVTGVQDRIAAQSREANKIAEKYLAITDEIDSVSNNKDRLKEYFGSGNYFEKQVFYLAKYVFKRSERWGKQNKRESDGAVIFPQQNRDKDRVLSFDAKLSYEEDGYNFTPSEEDQATRYILHDNDWERLKVKTGDNQLDAHILLSQNFDEDKFRSMADSIRSHFDVFTDDKVTTTIGFMTLEALVELFKLKRELYEYQGKGDLVTDFNRFFYEAATITEDRENYALITTEQIDEIDRKVTRIASELGDDRLRPYSPAGRET